MSESKAMASVHKIPGCHLAQVSATTTLRSTDGIPPHIKAFFTQTQQTEARKKLPARTPSISNVDKMREVPANSNDPEQKEILLLEDIQGDVLVGFNKPFFIMVGLQFQASDVVKVKSWLQNVLSPTLTSCTHIMEFRDSFREKRYKTNSKTEALKSIQQTCVNVALSFSALSNLIGKEEASKFDDEHFVQGLDSRNSHEHFGDPDPNEWFVGSKVGDKNNVLDIVLQIGADTEALITACTAQIVDPYVQSGLFVKAYNEMGYRNPELPGHEHFGFLDGIGQPAFRGVYIDKERKKAFFSPRTISPSDPTANNYSYPGVDLIWPGEFLFGYTTPLLDDHTRPDPKGFNTTEFGNYPAWAKGGTLLTFRRLRQDVPAFWNYCQEQRKIHNPTVTDIDIASRMIGRWPSGAPLERAPIQDNPELGANLHSNNNFRYFNDSKPTPLLPNHEVDGHYVAKGDFKGTVCPVAAHLRKVHPRDDTDEPKRGHRIIRRGSPYGPAIEDKTKQDGVDRGLLFVAYSASIVNGFAFIQKNWANNHDSPSAQNSGHDFIIGQPSGKKTMKMKLPQEEMREIETSTRFVIPTGGAFMFVPPLSFIKNANSILYLIKKLK